MRKYLLMFFVLFLASAAYAKEYGHYDLKRLLTRSETPTGRQSGFNVGYFDQMLDDLLIHAKNYPPQFDTIQDQRRATQDIKMLSGLVDILIDVPSPNHEILLRAALVNHIGHNLDVPGAAEKADSIFKRILKAAPSDPKGNYMYGVFLAGVGKPKEALPYLEKALSVGVLDATYAMGLAFITLGEKEKALENLEAYKHRYPNNESVNNIINAIRDGKVEYNRMP